MHQRALAAETSTAIGQQSDHQHDGVHVERRAWQTLLSAKLASHYECEKLRTSPRAWHVAGHLSLTLRGLTEQRHHGMNMEDNRDAAPERYWESRDMEGAQRGYACWLSSARDGKQKQATKPAAVCWAVDELE